jgi:Flp pilus assembly protein TadG
MMIRLARAWKSKSGLAAVEFALIAPVLVTLFLGVVELCDALTCRQKVTSVASTAADLIAQQKQVTNAEMSNVFNALNSIIFPYTTTTAKIRITSIIDDGKGGGKVGWSDAQNMSPLTVGTPVTVPAGLITTGGSVIRAEITYGYGSPTAKLITGTVTMSDTFYARPRKAAQIARVAS